MDSVEQAVVAAVGRLEGDAEGFVRSLTVLEELEAAGTPGPRSELYALLVAIVGPEAAGLRLLEGRGNFGFMDNPPADPLYTECRLTALGRIVLHDGAGTALGLPIGLTNGDMTRGGEQPPFDAARVLDAATRLIDDPGLPDSEVAAVVGGPVFPTGCTVEGRVEDLLRGEPVELLLAARTTVVDDRRGRVLVITGLPPQVTEAEVQHDLFERFRRPMPGKPTGWTQTAFSSAFYYGDVEHLTIEAVFAEWADEADVMDRITSVDGLVESRRAHLPRPVAATLRDWIAALGPRRARGNIEKVRTHLVVS
ncbi:hypothetical protein [Actinomycetospora soli]|uniref:hypothetical protein n=1 Tax=Actinomycetospora soli TaxID=2893887 RepID=UPI001E4989DD|nr:hypothetical protein [Actinomycetospora soli]MCD2191627.1 hypothetical protein [Actinomycetospora soli]